MVKDRFFLTAILIFVFSFAKAQTIFSVDYASQADFKVYVVDYTSQADLLVYKVKYQSQAKDNQGLWFFVDYASQAEKTIYFVEYQSQADLLIYFVDYKSQASWKTNQKDICYIDINLQSLLIWS
jgi:hypothetical protein